MKFLNPELLWLLTLLPLMVVYYIYRTRQGKATVQISTLKAFAGAPKTIKYYLRHVPLVLRIASITLIIIALARPQTSESSSKSETEGIDIILSIDVSSSMLARDFEPDRITAAKDVAANFIMDRPNDRIGIVVFAGESYTQAPLTSDKASLLNLLAEAKSGVIDDGTAIGNGLATAVNRLRESDAKSKVAILLTDGVNNSGQIAPQMAAQIAQTYGIRVYTIGVGSIGTAPYPTMDMWGNITYTPMKVEIDEKILTEISNLTGGQYFRATDKAKLKDIYQEINALEKSKIDVENYTLYRELFTNFVLLAIILLVCEFLLSKLYLRQIP